MKTCCERLRDLFDEYEVAVRQADAHRPLGSGLLGMGPKRGDDPCHEAFDRQIAALCGEIAADRPPAEEVGDAVELLLRAEDDRAWPEYTRWMLIAVQRHALPLIPLLPEARRQALYAWYKKRYPTFRRLPVQQQLLKAFQSDQGFPARK
ncbi:MAG: hypothetical protein IKO07_03435 [Clostridia bacterium]|nr:hypothetical protein [Clostridia bacterium]